MRKVVLSIILCLFVLITFACDAKVIGLSVKPTKFDFEQVNIGDSSIAYFKIKNSSDETFKISKYQILGGGASNFEIVEGGSTPVYVRGENSIFIGVEFAPKDAGLLNAVIQIYHNAPSQINHVAITGIGVPVPRIEIDKTDIDFGTLLIGDSDKDSIEVENTGSDTLVLSSIDFASSSTPEFAIITGGSAPILLDPGEKHIIEIEFTPIADGISSNNLLIIHNAIDKGSPLTVHINGVGKSPIPGIDVDRTSPWDFGNIGLTLSDTMDLKVKSSGVNDLHISSIDLVTGAEFSITSIVDSGNTPVVFPLTMRVNAVITVSVKFEPSSVSPFNDTLVIVHDGVNTSSPLNIDLTGAGIVKPIVVTFNYTGSMQQWTVPAGITSIDIEVWGSEGGYDSSSGIQPGKGARMKGTFTVTPGETFNIMVGQKGQRNGGGGGSFVCKTNNDPIIIAGAGGGSASSTDSTAKHGQITTSGGTGAAGGGVGGTNGNGGAAGVSPWNAGAGGGLLTNGADGSSRGGQSYLNGGAGGNSGYGIGGYGGGGGGSGYVVGGGGGGYSGGGGGGNSSGGVGGGGGSFNSGTNQSNSAGVNSSNGKVEITYTP